MAEAETKLYVGAGYERPEGYVTVDLDPACKPDILANMAQLPMVADNSVAEVRADSAYEHLWPGEQLLALAEWRRVLRPGGLLALNWIPDFEAVARLYVEGARPGIFSEQFTLPEAFRYTHGMIVDQPDFWRAAFQMHKGIFDARLLRYLLALSGYTAIEVTPTRFGDEPYIVSLCVRARKPAA